MWHFNELLLFVPFGFEWFFTGEWFRNCQCILTFNGYSSTPNARFAQRCLATQTHNWCRRWKYSKPINSLMTTIYANFLPLFGWWFGSFWNFIAVKIRWHQLHCLFRLIDTKFVLLWNEHLIELTLQFKFQRHTLIYGLFIDFHQQTESTTSFMAHKNDEVNKILSYVCLRLTYKCYWYWWIDVVSKYSTTMEPIIQRHSQRQLDERLWVCALKSYATHAHHVRVCSRYFLKLCVFLLLESSHSEKVYT